MASNRIKGLTIEIDANTVKLTDALQKVDSSLRNTQSQLRDVNKLLKLDPTNTDLLKQKQKLLGDQVELTKQRLDELKKAQEQMDAKGIDKNSEQYQALQREIIETEQKLKSAEKASADFSQAMEKHTKTVKERLKEVSSAAKEVQEKTEKLSAAAAVGAAGMLAMAGKAGATADELLTMSNVTGFSVEELQKMQYASERVDVSMDAMTGSITKLTSNMAKGSSVFDELGISITDQDGKMRDATDVWYEALEALSKIENETERDQVSMELFGKRAMDMAGIVDDGGEALRQLGEEAEATGTILSTDAVESAGKFNDQIDELKARASQAFLSAGASLADSLLPALETLVDVIGNVLSWFGQLDGGTQTFILTILGLVAAISPIAGMIATITSMAAALNVALLPMIGTIGAIVVAIAAVVAIGVALYKNWDTIKQKASELWNSLKTTFENIKNTIGEKIEGAKQKVHDAIEKIKGMFKFKFEWPKLTLPHFSISGSMNPLKWLEQGTPKISVQWYRKAAETPYLFNSPSLIGVGDVPEVVIGKRKFDEMTSNQITNNITIIQQPGQDSRELARIMMDKISRATAREESVYA